jgi:hypothetical protein
MNQTIDRLEHILAATPVRLAAVSDTDAERPPAPGRWSKKEILGHLIDSAANNHQRFVRAQLAASLQFPAYEQERWVAAQSYVTESWSDLVKLWLFYNRHLLHIVRILPEASLSTACTIGANAPVPLSEIVSGYVDHLERHLAQILG